MRYCTLFFLSLLSHISAYALELTGALTQGGYVIGQTAPHAQVLINNQPFAADAQGMFVYGLARNAPPSLQIRTMTGTGKVSYRELIIEPRDFPSQAIQGVPAQTVTPNPAQVARSQQETATIRAARAGVSTLTGYQTCCQWPIQQEIQRKHITGVYGSNRTYNGEERSWHKGVDLAFRTGTPIFPAAPGQVVFAAHTFFNGNFVLLDHGAGIFSAYAHLDTITTQVGELLNLTDQLGTLGNTGRSTGPHLHWGMYWQQTALDPILWLKEGR